MPRSEAAALQAYLRALWGIAPEIDFDAEAPRLERGRLRLPATAPWPCHCAAAAHAAAHLRHSPPVFDGRGLVPLARALVGVLEDARVEALAARDLPGLQRLWAGQHTATPQDGNDAPALLRRLARALSDPDYADPHPWVAKGRALFEADRHGTATATLWRSAASRLGHDLGQMRLQINARTWRPEPGYRDDNVWMWPEGAADETPAGATPPPTGHGEPAPRGLPRDAGLLPEWDRLIGRLRQRWVQVLEHEPAAATPIAPESPRLLRALRSALAQRPATQRARQRADSGERFDDDALVRAALAWRLRQPIEPRLYRVAARQTTRSRAIVLLDRSASSADRGADGLGLLDHGRRAAALLAEALQAQGVATAVWAFASEGRGALHMSCLQTDAVPVPATTLRARLAALRPGGSTRLGAAIRHLSARPGPATLVVIGDCQPHDVDVHDPRYLPADSRHALRAALRRSHRGVGLVLDAQQLSAARRLFGAGQVVALSRVEELPRALRRLTLV